MTREEADRKVKTEFINILAEKFGISKDEEAKQILWEVVFGCEKDF